MLYVNLLSALLLSDSDDMYIIRQNKNTLSRYSWRTERNLSSWTFLLLLWMTNITSQTEVLLQIRSVYVNDDKTVFILSSVCVCARVKASGDFRDTVTCPQHHFCPLSTHQQIRLTPHLRPPHLSDTHHQDFRKLYYTAYIIKHLITSWYDRPGWRAAGVDEEASLAGNDRQGASRSSRNIRVLYECHWQR